ncbi:Bug family tripartite tricarboxylate transporter substrate binding protein [Faunimonas sp. B44]|uniref:Bug family tripartite tricarboxylate transporter substrate binding protein n=1 Tax=Faunimonas sp. B44 TaxID=3461493 RepID=UPI0040448F41
MKRLGLAALALGLATFPAAAQNFPTGPVHIIVPFAAGGNVDVTARAIAPALGEILGQPVIVENRTGAGGMIGAESVMSAAPDGHTLMMGSNSTLSVGPNLFANWPYDPVEGITPITNIQFVPFALVVRADSPFQSVAEVLEKARAEPGDVTMAHAGTGTANHLVSELFQMLTETEFLLVPYQGGAPAMTDLLGGQVELYFDQASTTAPQVAAGRARALAVTSREPWPSLPGVATFASEGVENFELMNVTGLVGPAGIPDDVVETLRAGVAKALENPDVKARFEQLGVQVVGSSPDEFMAFIKEDLARWGDVIEKAGIEVK